MRILMGGVAATALATANMSRWVELGGIALLLAVTACDRTVTPPTTPGPPPPVTVSPVPTPPAPTSPTDPIAGRYTLDLSVGSGCDGVPEAARHRRYTAAIDSADGAKLVVTLSEARFLDGPICWRTPSALGCNQFLASRTGDRVLFDLINENDYGHGGHISEQLPEGTWIFFEGSATGRVQDGVIAATGGVSAWYCSTVSSYPFPCRAVVSCESDDFRLTFTRK